MSGGRAVGAPWAMFRSLHVANFRRYFIGSAVSNVGVWMMRTGQSWVVLHLGGGSGAALGVVTFLQFAPTLLFSVGAGSLADRFDKATVLTLTQSLVGLAGLAMALLDVLDLLDLVAVYALAAFVGIVTAVDAPVRQAFASELVGGDNVVNAIGLNSASFNVARLVGPVVAAALIAGAGTWLVFLLTFASSGAIVASLVRIDRSRLVRGPLGARVGGWASGFVCVARNPLLLCFVALAALGNATGANSLQVLLPIVATESFGGGALLFGSMTSTLALGGLVGALAASSLSGVPRARWVLAAIVGFGGTLVLLGACGVLVLFVPVLVLVGAACMGFVVLVNTAVQLHAPPAYRGRVVAVYMMFFLGGAAVGSPVLGLMTDLLGPMRTLWVTGVVVIVAGLAAALALHLALRTTVAAELPGPGATGRRGGVVAPARSAVRDVTGTQHDLSEGDPGSSRASRTVTPHA